MDKYLMVDVDGVTVNTYEPFLKEMNHRKGTNYVFKDIIDYGMEKYFPITREELIDIFASLDDTQLPLLDPNCPKIIDELRSNGYVCELVSAHIPTKKGGLEDLIICLDNHKINYDYITFVDNSDHNAKGKMANMYEYAIDDAPHHIKAVSHACKGILYNAPYNLKVDAPYAYARVNNWTDIKRLLIK
jgi:5'(3')-deoxyribonucleotidase